tara:strand:+ start:478 stop:603 length:126 start_codon:yes stop_codon:yes gene_type:complete
MNTRISLRFTTKKAMKIPCGYANLPTWLKVVELPLSITLTT